MPHLSENTHGPLKSLPSHICGGLHLLIPVNARLFAVVGVWEALSSNRPYRTAWPQRQVLDYIQHQSNKHFEPEITSAFLEIVKGKSYATRSTVPMFRRALTDSFGQAN